MATDPPDSLAGRSVVVTGGAGFVGSHLARALAPACDVTVLDDLSTGDRDAVPDDARFVEGDVRDAALLADVLSGADVVFHQAAMADAAATVRAPLESHHRNATGTVTLLDAARRADARVVFASSAAVYGDPDSLPVSETDPKRPRSPYGIDKLAADRYVRRFADLYGLPTVALRYFNVYGRSLGAGGTQSVIDAFLARARADGALTVHGDGEQTRDFVHVRDVVRANLLAAAADVSGRAYNVGTGEATSVRDLADSIRDLLDSSSPVVHAEPREGDVRHSRAAVERAARELGFEPQVSLREGLTSLADAPNARR